MVNVPTMAAEVSPLAAPEIKKPDVPGAEVTTPS
jgi:hypothetical protein